MEIKICSECEANWQDEISCEEYFHQMLFWENEYPGYGEVHFLMVLCFCLQHPSRFTPEWLEGAKQLLVDFSENKLNPNEIRRRNNHKIDSGKRTWKIKATSSRQAVYVRPIIWTITAQDVTAAGPRKYVESVRLWAASILEDLKISGNLQSA